MRTMVLSKRKQSSPLRRRNWAARLPALKKIYGISSSAPWLSMQQQRTPVAGAMQEQSFWMASFDRAKHHGRPEDYVLAEATNNDRNWGMGLDKGDMNAVTLNEKRNTAAQNPQQDVACHHGHTRERCLKSMARPAAFLAQGIQKHMNRHKTC